MLAIQINNPIIENYFRDSVTIERLLEYIAINKIPIENERDLTNKLIESLEDIVLLISGKKKEVKARDFLNGLWDYCDW